MSTRQSFPWPQRQAQNHHPAHRSHWQSLPLRSFERVLSLGTGAGSALLRQAGVEQAAQDEVLIDVDDVGLGHATKLRWNDTDQWVWSEKIVQPRSSPGALPSLRSTSRTVDRWLAREFTPLRLKDTIHDLVAAQRGKEARGSPMALRGSWP